MSDNCPITKANAFLIPLRKIADKFGSPLWDITARLFVSYEFFKSGLTRGKDWLNGSFDNQLFLFELEHPVPGLNPEFAAYSATLGELILPVLLTLGLFSRFSAAGLFVMAAVIQFTYIESYQHVLWMFLTAGIFVKGAGFLSLDYHIVKWLNDCTPCKKLSEDS